MSKGAKVNAAGSKGKFEDLMGSPNMELTGNEKAVLEILIANVQRLDVERQKAGNALSHVITTIVTERKLDTRKFGVNLGVGRILPVNEQPGPDGAKPEGAQLEG